MRAEYPKQLDYSGGERSKRRRFHRIFCRQHGLRHCVGRRLLFGGWCAGEQTGQAYVSNEQQADNTKQVRVLGPNASDLGSSSGAIVFQ